MAKPKSVQARDDEDLDLEAALSDFDAIAGEEVVGSGFSPYCKPQVGRIYDCMPTDIDMRDPNFTRYVYQNLGKDLPCAAGPINDAEEVIVKTGEFFSMSEYRAIPFVALLGLRVQILCTGRRNLPPKDGKPRTAMYEFKYKMSPENKVIYTGRCAQQRLDAQKRYELVKANGAAQLAITPSTGLPVQQLAQ